MMRPSDGEMPTQVMRIPNGRVNVLGWVIMAAIAVALVIVTVLSLRGQPKMPAEIDGFPRSFEMSTYTTSRHEDAMEQAKLGLNPIVTRLEFADDGVVRMRYAGNDLEGKLAIENVWGNEVCYKASCAPSKGKFRRYIALRMPQHVDTSNPVGIWFIKIAPALGKKVRCEWVVLREDGTALFGTSDEDVLYHDQLSLTRLAEPCSWRREKTADGELMVFERENGSGKLVVSLGDGVLHYE